MPRATRAPVPGGHLLRDENTNSAFYLQIPVNIISDLSLRPLKYVHSDGWRILDAEGVLALDTDGNLDREGHARRTLTACYRFNQDLARVIDLEVIKTRTNVPL